MNFAPFFSYFRPVPLLSCIWLGVKKFARREGARPFRPYSPYVWGRWAKTFCLLRGQLSHVGLLIRKICFLASLCFQNPAERIVGKVSWDFLAPLPLKSRRVAYRVLFLGFNSFLIALSFRFIMTYLLPSQLSFRLLKSKCPFSGESTETGVKGSEADSISRKTRGKSRRDPQQTISPKT